MTLSPEGLPTDTGLVLRAQSIKLILMDCDGVLTDGRIILLPDGEEIKNFHVLDGQGIALAKRAGLRVGIISGRRSRVLERRASESHCDFLRQQVEDKLAAYEAIVAEAGLTYREVAYIGDDLPDLAPMRRAGLAIAVANAVIEVKATAQLITRQSGGDGAVREAIEFILRAQARWQSVLNGF
ncbi:MAG: HAD-IIIA family hydrolase [Acidobacteriota bacterium]